MRTKVLILAMVFFCSFDSKETNDSSNSEPIIKLDLLSVPGQKIQKLSEFATSVEYIPLQTKESTLMGGFTRKIVKIEKRIYIQNRDAILCFDIVGKFLYKLNNAGRGPEEYGNIADFDVSSDNKNLTILTRNKLLLYGISEAGFTFKRSLALKDPNIGRISLIPETDNAFLAIAPWKGTETTLSLLINTLGDTIQFKPNCYKYQMLRKTFSMSSNEMLVYSIDNKVCFKEEFSDTVFYVDTKTNLFKPRMILDSHGTLSKAEMRGSPQKPSNNTTFIAYLFETTRYVFYWYDIWIERPISNLILFDKTTKAKYRLNIENGIDTKLVDDLSGGPDFNVAFLNNYCSGGKLFSLVDALNLKKYVGSDDFKKAKISDSKRAEIKKIADDLTETDNPVLVVLTPKN
jgi:hypothetical protein